MDDFVADKKEEETKDPEEEEESYNPYESSPYDNQGHLSMTLKN